MLEYHNCPRCLSPWVKSNDSVFINALSCIDKTECNMIYYPISIESPFKLDSIMICRNIIKHEDSLIWNIVDKFCLYLKNSSSKEVSLPWLKFDIEANKLKKYLLFS